MFIRGYHIYVCVVLKNYLPDKGNDALQDIKYMNKTDHNFKYAILKFLYSVAAISASI